MYSMNGGRDRMIVAEVVELKYEELSFLQLKISHNRHMFVGLGLCSGTFIQPIREREVVTVGNIPPGKIDINIKLTSVNGIFVAVKLWKGGGERGVAFC